MKTAGNTILSTGGTREAAALRGIQRHLRQCVRYAKRPLISLPTVGFGDGQIPLLAHHP